MNRRGTSAKIPTITRAVAATCLLLPAIFAGAGGVGPPAAAATGALACAGTSSDLDLNGDGFDDAVIGDPYATVNGKAGAGAVFVLYGDADCRIGEGARRVISQSTAGIPGTSESGDHFGWSVAVDDLTGDGRADILVGSPGEDVGSAADAGAVHVISLTAGSSTSAATAVSLNQGDLHGAAEAGDAFGYTVAAADAEGDESGSLAAAGAPGEDVAGVTDAGVVEAFGYSGSSWVLAAQFQQGSGGSSPFTVALPGVAQTGDRFGAALIIAQLNAPFTGDVLAGPQSTYVIGAPGDVVAGRDNAGSVSLYYTETNAQEQVSQDSVSVPGVAESGDEFGASLAVHETRSWRNEQTRTLLRQLAVGAPGEDVGSDTDAGSVTLFRSEVSGLKARAVFTQDSPGFGGAPESGDRFGQSVAMRSEPGSSDAVLVIGVPSEDIGRVANAGMVQAVSVTPTKIEALRTYSEASAHTPGTLGAGHQFGLAVVAMQGRAETLWAVSSPYYGTGSVFVSNQSGQERSWVPGRGGIPQTSPAGRFGWAVAGLESGG